MSPKVHVISADADKFFVNAFIIEGEKELVLVDTHFVVSSTEKLLGKMSALGKPLGGVIITHPHPDHYNGLAQVRHAHPSAPVFATEPTLDGVKATRAQKRETWTPVYGDDYPKEDATPDHVLPAQSTIELAGVELNIVDLGGFECALDNSAIHVPAADALIASDLIYNGCHPWLAEHGTGRWLEQIDAVEARFGACAHVFAGHGASGDRGLFGSQRSYIRAFREDVAAVARDGKIAPDEMADLVRRTREGRQGWPLEGLIEMNAAAVAEELLAG